VKHRPISFCFEKFCNSYGDVDFLLPSFNVWPLLLQAGDGKYTAEDIERSLTESLEALKSDYVDLYQVSSCLGFPTFRTSLV